MTRAVQLLQKLEGAERRERDLTLENAKLRERLRLAELRQKAPYGPMCRDPDLCVGKGSCPLNPTCGD